MQAVSDHLLQAIKDIQKLSSFKQAALGGGTNLALRYGHRTSVDIDLFFDGIIGKKGFNVRISLILYSPFRSKLYANLAAGFFAKSFLSL